MRASSSESEENGSLISESDKTSLSADTEARDSLLSDWVIYLEVFLFSAFNVFEAYNLFYF